MLEVEVIDNPEAAASALDPTRARILGALREPASAAGVATRLGLPRQLVRYHLGSLERHGLALAAGTRKWGGITERLLVAKAASFVVSPLAVGALAPDPERTADRLSAGYLIALGARLVREVGGLMRGAEAAGKHLPTLAVDAEVRFRSPADRAAFTAELTQAITQLVGRYHDPTAPGGRPHRLLVAAYPTPVPPDPTPEEDTHARSS